MEPQQQELLVDALRFALEAHGDQTRKGKDQEPYASHLLRVAGMVLEHSGDPALAAVGILHDTIEDCQEVDRRVLHSRFGEELALRVDRLSDVLEGDTPERKSPWLERKERYVARLGGADAPTRLVAGCDKVDNLRALVADLEVEGPATLKRFSGSPRQIRWYYEAVYEVIGAGLPQRLAREFQALLERLASYVPEASEGR